MAKGRGFQEEEDSVADERMRVEFHVENQRETRSIGAESTELLEIIVVEGYSMRVESDRDGFDTFQDLRLPFNQSQDRRGRAHISRQLDVVECAAQSDGIPTLANERAC